MFPTELKGMSSRTELVKQKSKKLLRKHNQIYRKIERNGYKIEDKVILDRLRNESSEAIKNDKRII